MEDIMRTNIELNDALVEQAMSLTKIKTKKTLVNKALEELVKANLRKGILKFENSGIWEGNLEEMRTTRW
jgi:Arc/MetJ family transcription regulator